jgi:hypothetical protein
MNTNKQIHISRRNALKGVGLSIGAYSLAGLGLIGTQQSASGVGPVAALAIPTLIQWIKPQNIKHLGHYKKMLLSFLTKGVEKLANTAKDTIKVVDEITDMIIGADFLEKNVDPAKLGREQQATHWQNIAPYKLNDPALEGVLGLPQFSLIMQQLLRINPNAGAVTSFNDLNLPEIGHAQTFTERNLVPAEPIVPLRDRNYFNPNATDFWDLIRGRGDMNSPQNLTDLDKYFEPIYTRKLHGSPGVGVGFKKKADKSKHPEAALYWVFGSQVPSVDERTKIFGETIQKQ